jgi:hypothetical protein
VEPRGDVVSDIVGFALRGHHDVHHLVILRVTGEHWCHTARRGHDKTFGGVSRYVTRDAVKERSEW